MKHYKIVSFPADIYDRRFAIADAETGEIIDDAQGYGYTSRDKANKAAWYRFKGGKKVLSQEKAQAKAFWKTNKEFTKKVNDLVECCFKEYARHESSWEADSVQLAEDLNISGFDVKFLKYL